MVQAEDDFCHPACRLAVPSIPSTSRKPHPPCTPLQVATARLSAQPLRSQPCSKHCRVAVSPVFLLQKLDAWLVSGPGGVWPFWGG